MADYRGGEELAGRREEPRVTSSAVLPRRPCVSAARSMGPSKNGTGSEARTSDAESGPFFAVFVSFFSGLVSLGLGDGGRDGYTAGGIGLS